MSDVKLSLTQRQYMLLMNLVDTLPRALSNVGDVDVSDESTPDTPLTSSTPPTPVEEESSQDTGADLGPELDVTRMVGEQGQIWTSLDFGFSVASIGLELYGVNAILDNELETHSIAQFTLVQTRVGMKQLSDGAMEAEVSLQTLSFSNTRKGSSIFRDIIPASKHDGKQM